MSYPALTSTTLSAALAGPTATAAAATRLSVASTTGMAAYTASTPATTLVIGNEAMTVTAVINSTTVDVERGQQGSTALPHDSGTTVYFGNSTSVIGNLSTLSPPVYNLAAALTGQPQFAVNVGMKRMDPNTGYVYMLVDCQQATTVGDWLVIDANGLGTTMATTSKGRVGVTVETISASDTLSWVLVEGSFASASFTSDVTTACIIEAGTGRPALYGLTTADGNVIFSASCTTAPSTTVSTAITGAIGTAYLANPWVTGVALSILTS